MQHNFHNQITDNDEESIVKSNNINREVKIALDTIKKIIDEFTESIN